MLIIVIIAPTLLQRIKCHHLASFFCGFQGAQFYNTVPLLRKEWLPEKKNYTELYTTLVHPQQCILYGFS